MGWYRQYVRWHGKRHPQEMGAAEVEAFLTHLAVNRGVAAATQNQALIRSRPRARLTLRAACRQSISRLPPPLGCHASDSARGGHPECAANPRPCGRAHDGGEGGDGTASPYQCAGDHQPAG